VPPRWHDFSIAAAASGRAAKRKCPRGRLPLSSTVSEGSCAAGHASPSRDRNPAPSAPLIQGTKPGGIDPFGRRRRLPRTICHHIANQHIGLGTRHSRRSQIPQSPRSAPQFHTLLRALPNMFLRAVTARDAAMNSHRPVRIRWHPAGHGEHSSTPGKTFDHTASDSGRGGRVVIGSYRPRSSPWKHSSSVRLKVEQDQLVSGIGWFRPRAIRLQGA